MDFITCGSCQMEFLLSDIMSFMKHKKLDCDDDARNIESLYQRLMCRIKDCDEKFATAVGLLLHIQNQHSLNIFITLSVFKSFNIPASSSTNQPTSQEKSCCGTDKLQLCEVNALSSMSIGDTLDDIQKRSPCLDPSSTFGVNCCVPPKDAFSVSTQTDSDFSEVFLEENGCHGDKCTPEICAERMCCESQNCCITLMPGTHEKMKRCCSAVVPKKRKQHMESKHMPKGFWSRSKSTFRKRFNAGFINTKNRAQNREIYIDVGSPVDEEEVSSMIDTETQKNVVTKDTQTKTYESLPISVSRGGNSGHVFLEPGSSVTFPVSYSSSMTNRPTTINSLGMKNFVSSNQLSTYNSVMCNSQQVNQSDVTFIGHPGSTIIPDWTGALVIDENTNINHPIEERNQSQDHLVMTIATSNSGEDNSMLGVSSKSNKRRRYPTTRPFKCDQCDNSFNQRIHLKKHQSKHTGIKPFKCQQCDYSTVERSHLKVHIRIHTGEKPYKCTYCEYATAQNSTLKIHLKRHHNDSQISVSCSTCGKQFSHIKLLQSHQQLHTNVAQLRTSLDSSK